MPSTLRRLLWTAAFGALVARAVKGLSELNEPEPQEQPAQWPALAFDRADSLPRKD